MDSGKRGAVLLRVEGRLRFVPASVALRVAPSPRITPVPGAPVQLLGIALHDGMIVPVIAIGPARAEMIVCRYSGELVGLVGGEVVRTGAFESSSGRPNVIEHEGQEATPIDLHALCARVQSSVGPGLGGI